MRNFLDKSFPPGYRYEPELGIGLIALAAGMLISFVRFMNTYSDALRSLDIPMYLVKDDGTRTLIENRMMPDFVSILDDKLNILLLLAVLILVIASAIHYAYHFRDSKSIYLMRRLPNRLALYKRCLLVPLLFALVFVLMAAILLFVYYAIYMGGTPEASLAPGQWEKLWRGFL